MLNFWIASFLAMTRSDDKKCRPLAVNEIADQVRNDSKGLEYVVRNGSDNYGHRGWERQNSTGVGGEAWPPGGEAPARDG